MSVGCEAAYDRMTELEISSERFDRKRYDPPGSLRKYIICSTQRSGSFLLCRQLINAGIGVPQEYFNRLHIELLCGRWKLDLEDRQGYLSQLYARRSTPNGVWGCKLQWPQYAANRPVLEAGLLGACDYIFLYRTDVFSQAVSLHISVVTGIWGFDGTPTTAPRHDIRLGDFQHVARCARQIGAEYEAWRRLFISRKITPLATRYEDFAADQPGFVRRVAQFLGLDSSSYRVPPPEHRDRRLPPEVEAVRVELLERYNSSNA